MTETLRDKIKARLSELGIEPKRSLGQNFLVSDNVVEKIINGAKPKDFDQVVEIGPGLGALTDHLLKNSKVLKLFELDKKFCDFWIKQGCDVTEGDVLKHSWDDYPWSEKTNLLVSNLPYQISSRLVVEMSIRNPRFDRMVLMFQKEVAKRLTADESTEDYGLLTVIAQSFWKVQFLLEAGSVDFMPKPNVASRVLVFNKMEVDSDLYGKGYLTFVKACFENRRKKMLKKLEARFDKDHLREAFTSLDIDTGVRAEKLSPKQFCELYLLLRTKGGASCQRTGLAPRGCSE